MKGDVGWVVFFFTLFPHVVMGAPASLRIPIEVQVEVNEVDNSKAENLGFDWKESLEFSEISPNGVVSLGSFQRLSPLQMDLRYLIEEGAAELLANPNLVTDSGTTATFHAGGEIPYITSSSLGTTHVEFKPYGVRLEVRPLLLADGRIQMHMKAGVSAPDVSAGVSLSGNSVPALLARDVTSHVTLDSGASMTVAGLVQTQRTEAVQGVPFLRKIPILGAFFRWRRTNFRRTTIIIFVTPRVIPPRE
ncbi:MAG: hypothetical protein KCHDKBKB_01245 [Elusimicrobia bacterium]|nr:hypothetical protein [Elusimicrobiota bacterium]